MIRSRSQHDHLDSAGVTLVELLIVLVIVAVGVLALGGIQTKSSSSVFSNGRNTRALSVGQAQIEVARAAGWDVATPDSGASGIFNWNTRVDSVNVGLKQVTVRVTWAEAGRQRNLQLNTLLSTR